MITDLEREPEMSSPTWKLTVPSSPETVVHNGLTRLQARTAISALMRGAELPTVSQPHIDVREDDREHVPVAA